MDPAKEKKTMPKGDLMDSGKRENAAQERWMADPALLAAEVARRAEATFLSLEAKSVIDEFSARFIEAETQWAAADESFADSVPTSPAGALAKLRALQELYLAMAIDADSLELRHIRALMTYFERLSD
jgi:hypothetical protein